MRRGAKAAPAADDIQPAEGWQKLPRAPFCGMGVCQECRVTANGRRVLACQTLCLPGMNIERSRHANATL
ncbi:2Fe-2S iron-sulfur cluster-binding protein [Raoultella terrigena]|uniref:2Fe-2S iron-sulfur cluster-binding protein n=1 Tax=Raoultella terrigena TaxID=577 RepID=UPI00349F4211